MDVSMILNKRPGYITVKVVSAKTIEGGRLTISNFTGKTLINTPLPIKEGITEIDFCHKELCSGMYSGTVYLNGDKGYFRTIAWLQ